MLRTIPALSSKPEKRTGRYYVTFRDHQGKVQKLRFHVDLNVARRLHGNWVADGCPYPWEGQGVAAPDAPPVYASLPVIANGYMESLRQRVRPDDAPRARGTISGEEYANGRIAILNILGWSKDHFGHRFRETPFGRLFTMRDYDAMMIAFTGKYSTSHLNRHRYRFWDMVKYAKWNHQQALPFGKEDTQKYGGKPNPKERRIPSVAVIRALLEHADLRMRTWIWMAIGMGFGQDDLSRCRPGHFDKDAFDMRRGKTGVDRFGDMRPMVWAHIRLYLKQHPRASEDLMFVTRKDFPLVHKATKTSEEMAVGGPKGPSKTLVKKTDTVKLCWRRLQERCKDKIGGWSEGFYVWRHLGATAMAHRPNVSLVQMRTFLGHGKSEVADHYMKKLSPGVKSTVTWINEMLDQADPYAWKEKTQVPQERGTRRKPRPQA